MYSNRTLYYLQQLGICPWIRRGFYTATEPQLLMVVSAPLSASAKQLLDKIISFIAIDKNKMTLVEMNDSFCPPPNIGKHIALIFGDDLVKTLPENTIARFITLDLEILLNNPIKKRDVLSHLLEVKELLKRAA